MGSNYSANAVDMGILDSDTETGDGSSGFLVIGGAVGRDWEAQQISRGKTGYRVIKRLFDIVASLLGMIILSPVLLIVALAVKMEDHGPVFYTQERIGENKKKFLIYKFRSMKQDADQIHEELRGQYDCNEVSFKLKEDPRVTGVGRVIRASNIDELPQLINIIRGDMSIVGPRPLPVYEFLDEQKRYDGKFDDRYAVPQGLTCYWQVADRSSISFEKRMEMDVAYAGERGVLTDLKLILKTMAFTVIGKAAY